MMNRQGGGANAKAMSFGKSRAKLSTEKDKKSPLHKWQGLRKKKEELEEVVDFLKSPKNIFRLAQEFLKESFL